MSNKDRKHKLDKSSTATLNFVDASGKDFTINLVQALSISDATIENDMANQPALYVWWASILERAKLRLKQAQDNEEYTRSLLAAEIRKENPKITVAALSDALMLSEDYREAREDIRYWEGEVGILSYVVKAFEQRKDMLVQKSAQLRKTMNNENLR